MAVGFSQWRSPQGEVYETLPSRAFGAGNERRPFDGLRSAEGSPSEVKRVKTWILEDDKTRPYATRCARGPFF